MTNTYYSIYLETQQMAKGFIGQGAWGKTIAFLNVFTLKSHV